MHFPPFTRLAAAAALAVAAPFAAAAPTYDATLLTGPHGERVNAAALNATGSFAGYVPTSTSPSITQAYVGNLKGGQVVPLGAYDSSAYAISSAGDSLGLEFKTSSSPEQYWVQRAGGQPQVLVLPTAYSAVTPAAINAAGTVAGSITTAQDATFLAFTLIDGTYKTYPSTLGGTESGIWAINDAGQMAGVMETAQLSVMHAVAWSADGTASDLGSLVAGGYSYASSISSDGHWIAGAAEVVAPRLGTGHATLWHDGQITDLGLLHGTTTSTAHGVNAVGDVVGVSVNKTSSQIDNNHAVLWHKGKAIDLNTVTNGLPTGMVLHWAYAINDKGQILAQGVDAQGVYGSFLLKPHHN